MLRKLTIIACFLSFSPVAAGAQELAVLVNSQPAQQSPATLQPAREVDLSPPAARQATVVAANDLVGNTSAEQRPRKTHTGLTFQEFCEVHFGEYRWIYWVGAAAIIIGIHVVAAR
jgi:hypothetical protein